MLQNAEDAEQADRAKLLALQRVTGDEARTELWDRHKMQLRFPKNAWEIMKIHDFSSIFHRFSLKILRLMIREVLRAIRSRKQGTAGCLTVRVLV